jgi:hypothetical protein
MSGKFIIAFAVITLGLSLICTRGADGSLGGAVLGFGLLGVFYCGANARYGKVGFANVLIDLLALEAAAVVGMIIDAGLREMAGMLYIMIPLMVLGVVVAGWIAATLGGRAQRRREEGEA